MLQASLKQCDQDGERNAGWHVHSRGGVLPSGFGFAFMYRAVVFTEHGCRYGGDTLRADGKTSGEEDVLYDCVVNSFGKDRIHQIPLSEAFQLALHLENGDNISGATSVFRFPTDKFVAVPRPLDFLHPDLVDFL